MSSKHAHGAPNDSEHAAGSYFPLVLLLAYVIGASLVIALTLDTWSASALGRWIMAGVFIGLSYFKLLDLRGFVSSYRMYDPLAKVLPAWAWLYPFLEIAFAAAYILNAAPLITNCVVLGVLSINAIGVITANHSGKHLRCGCMGTVIDLPLTTVTLAEDISMGVMAALMLALELLAS